MIRSDEAPDVPEPGDLLDISNSVVPPSRPIKEPRQQDGNNHGSDEESDEDVLDFHVGDDQEENLHLVLAMNEAASELVRNMIEKTQEKLNENLAKQKALMEHKKHLSAQTALAKKKVPVNLFLPPYFKDSHGMCPPQNEETRRKMECMVYDPLLKEDKKWTPDDLKILHRAVRENMIEARLLQLYSQRDILLEKRRAADVTTTQDERDDWTNRLDTIARKIEYERSLPDKDVLNGDYSNVDWAAIAMTYFKGLRTPISLRLKWCNEQSPQWSKAPWTPEEIKTLHHLATVDFISWSVVAEKLGTRRTPWQCFEKYKSEMSSEIVKREWTQDEDQRLIRLVETLQLNGAVQWDKVTYHMAGRTRQQCRMRYMRTLDKSIKHGRWTDEEDLLLMCSIGRYGAKDWRKVAKGVPGRSDGQCRERWANVLDRSNRSQEWTMEEDEKLLYAVNMFGKGQWAKIASVLSGRSGASCKARFRSLLTTKMRLCAAQLSKIRAAQRHSFKSFYHKKREQLFGKFNQLLDGDDEDGSQFCERARQQAQTGKRAPRRKVVAPEVARVIQEGVAEIEQRHQAGQGDQNSDNLFEQYLGSKDDSAQRPDQSWIDVDFVPTVDEETRKQRLTEAICQLVHVQDQQIALAEIEKDASLRAQTEVEKILINTFGDELEARIQSALTVDGAHASATLLPPSVSTMHAAELLKKEMPKLTRIAKPLLSTMAGDGPQLELMEDAVNVLKRKLATDVNFIAFKEEARSMLSEPLLLAFALESRDERKKFFEDEFARTLRSLITFSHDVEGGGANSPIKPKGRKSGASQKRKWVAMVPAAQGGEKTGGIALRMSKTERDLAMHERETDTQEMNGSEEDDLLAPFIDPTLDPLPDQVTAGPSTSAATVPESKSTVTKAGTTPKAASSAKATPRVRKRPAPKAERKTPAKMSKKDTTVDSDGKTTVSAGEDHASKEEKPAKMSQLKTPATEPKNDTVAVDGDTVAVEEPTEVVKTPAKKPQRKTPAKKAKHDTVANDEDTVAAEGASEGLKTPTKKPQRKTPAKKTKKDTVANDEDTVAVEGAAEDVNAPVTKPQDETRAKEAEKDTVAEEDTVAAGKATEDAETPVKRSRGRPPKAKKDTVPEENTPTVKRPRGRPPKKAADTVAEEDTVGNEKEKEATPAKRSRGRPPKKAKEDTTVVEEEASQVTVADDAQAQTAEKDAIAEADVTVAADTDADKSTVVDQDVAEGNNEAVEQEKNGDNGGETNGGEQ